MVVIGIFVADQPKVQNCVVVSAAVKGQRRCVQPFFQGLGRVFPRRDVPLTNIQVETHSLEELALFRVRAQDGLEALSRRTVIVPLKRRQTLFVYRNSLEVCRSPLNRGRLDRGLLRYNSRRLYLFPHERLWFRTYDRFASGGGLAGLGLRLRSMLGHNA